MDVGVRDLRDGLSRHLASVRAGVEITVTDHGKPVARLVPYGSDSGIERFVAPVVMRELQARADERGLSIESLFSELAELGLASSRSDAPTIRNGIPVLSAGPSHVMTDELVAEYRDDL